ncbi:MAG TPA: 50S ribosomal protein L21 [Patescibacteria group bacterium]|nr:50S ribosomal protein L21 [Patescibacteria group bacterium]
MKYSIIRLQGRQYKVSEGEELLVDRMNDLKLEPEVLLVADGETVKVGKPTVKGASVKLKIVTEIEKGVKIDVYHFKAKSRYRKHTGFRPQYTRVLVEKITS